MTMTKLRKLLPNYPISLYTTLGTIDREALGLRDDDWVKVDDFVNEALERGYDYDTQLCEIYENDPQILARN